MRVQVKVIRVPEIPGNGRAFIDRGGRLEPLVVWVRESLVTQDEAAELEAELMRTMG